MTIEELQAQINALTVQLQQLQGASTTGPNTFAGGSQIIYGTIWDEMKRQETEEQDPKASALLELRKEIKDEVLLLKQDGGKFKNNLEEYRSGLKRVDSFLVTITLVVVVAFITTISLVFWDMIKDKDVYLRNNDLYQIYSEKNYQQLIEINNLKNEINVLRAKNSYLK